MLPRPPSPRWRLPPAPTLDAWEEEEARDVVGDEDRRLSRSRGIIYY
jgi:hypothetical protein